MMVESLVACLVAMTVVRSVDSLVAVKVVKMVEMKDV